MPEPTDPREPGPAGDRYGRPDELDADVAAFWQRVRHRVQRDPFARLSVVVGQSGAGVVTPPAFSFGATREQADEQLALVLAGTKTATSSALVEHRQPPTPGGAGRVARGRGGGGADEDSAGAGPADAPQGDAGSAALVGRPPLPQVGDLAIVLDGEGHPRAVIRTTAVEVTALGLVPAEHAVAECEGDGSLAAWCRDHAAYWGKRVDEAGDWPVVLERFALVHPRPPGRRR